jgi:hypothetical protein
VQEVGDYLNSAMLPPDKSKGKEDYRIECGFTRDEKPGKLLGNIRQ